MQFDKNRQWVGAVYAEDLALLREMINEDASLANSSHREFDDPFRAEHFPVPTLLFALPSMVHRLSNLNGTMLNGKLTSTWSDR